MDTQRNLILFLLSHLVKTAVRIRGSPGKGRLMNGNPADGAGQFPTDETISDLFFARDERAIAETERKYGRLFRSIAAGITDSVQDAMECVNDTYLRLWNSIPPERPRSLKAYGGRIVRNLAINRAEYNGASCRGGAELLAELDESVPDTSPHEPPGEISRAIDSFLRTQDKASRSTFILRYWYCLPLDEIAKRTGTGVAGVKSRLFRTRNKLKKYLEKEGILL